MLAYSLLVLVNLHHPTLYERFLVVEFVECVVGVLLSSVVTINNACDVVSCSYASFVQSLLVKCANEYFCILFSNL